MGLKAVSLHQPAHGHGQLAAVHEACSAGYADVPLEEIKDLTLYWP